MRAQVNWTMLVQLSPPALAPMRTQGLRWGTQDPYKECQGALSARAFKAGGAAQATGRRPLMGRSGSRGDHRAVSLHSCSMGTPGVLQPAELRAIQSDKDFNESLHTCSNVHTQEAHSSALLHKHKHFLPLLAGEPLDLSLKPLQSWFEIFWTFLEKRGPDLEWEVVFRSHEHWLCRPLFILQAIIWVFCWLQDRTVQIIFVWSHQVLNGLYVVPRTGHNSASSSPTRAHSCSCGDKGWHRQHHSDCIHGGGKSTTSMTPGSGLGRAKLLKLLPCTGAPASRGCHKVQKREIGHGHWAGSSHDPVPQQEAHLSPALYKLPLRTQPTPHHSAPLLRVFLTGRLLPEPGRAQETQVVLCGWVLRAAASSPTAQHKQIATQWSQTHRYVQMESRYELGCSVQGLARSQPTLTDVITPWISQCIITGIQATEVWASVTPHHSLIFLCNGDIVGKQKLHAYYLQIIHLPWIVPTFWRHIFACSGLDAV